MARRNSGVHLSRCSYFNWRMISLFLFAGQLFGSFSFGQTLSSTTLSPTEIRDGATITLTCQLNVSTTSTLSLACGLAGEEGERLHGKDDNSTATYAPGIYLLSRTWRINLRPDPESCNDSTDEDDGEEYSAVWELRHDGEIVDATTQTAALTILPAINIHIPILMYHKVLSVSGFDTVSVEAFRGQMRMLKAYGYTSVTFDDLMDYRAGLAVPPPKPIILTADDGYQSWLKYVLPILSDPSINFRMTGFLQTGAIDVATTNTTADDPYLTWDQALQLERSGFFDLQPHTITHPHMPNVSDAKAWQELTVSKNKVETHLGKESRFFAYPYGEYSPRDQQLAWEAGYFLATTDSGGVEQNCQDKWDLDRVGIYTSATLEYQRPQAWAFFPTLIGDPDVVIPNIVVQSISFVDTATSSLLTDKAMTGSYVTINLTACNKGVLAKIKPSIRVYKDGITSPTAGSLCYFTPRITTPETVNFPWGLQTFRWVWYVPPDAEEGPYTIEVVFSDQYDILVFHREVHTSALTLKVKPSGVTNWILY